MITAFSVGDTLEMKKKHPCGETRFLVLRIGSDIRIRCRGCDRDLVLPRIKLEPSVRRVIPKSTETER